MLINNNAPSFTHPKDGHNKQYDASRINAVAAPSVKGVITEVMLTPSPSVLEVRVHVNLLSNIVQKRHENKKKVLKRAGYRVNKVIKPIAFYYVLKSLTTSGVIQDYPNQLAALTKQLNCVNSTFYANLKKCRKMGLVAVNGRDLILAGYSQVGEYFGELYTGLLTINYDFTKDKFYQLMELAYIAVIQATCETQFNAKVDRMPELQALYKRTLAVTQNTKNFAPELRKYQVYCFIHGHKHYDELMYLNPDFNVNARTLRSKFNFKSYRSVAYLKKKLAKKGLLTIEIDRSYTSQVRSRLKYREKKRHFKPYDDEKKQTVWKLPDALTVAPNKVSF